MKKYIYLIPTVFIIVLIVFFIKNNSNQFQNWQSIKVSDKTVKIEIADTPEKREKGLSGRENLCKDCGLLFIFENPATYPFWMKEMNFNIDIIWILGNKIVDISSNVQKPLPEESLSPKIIYQSNSAVDKVLEVNAGWCEKNGITAGDIIQFEI
jgi:hypothetical protein